MQLNEIRVVQILLQLVSDINQRFQRPLTPHGRRHAHLFDADNRPGRRGYHVKGHDDVVNVEFARLAGRVVAAGAGGLLDGAGVAVVAVIVRRGQNGRAGGVGACRALAFAGTHCCWTRRRFACTLARLPRQVA